MRCSQTFYFLHEVEAINIIICTGLVYSSYGRVNGDGHGTEGYFDPLPLSLNSLGVTINLLLNTVEK